MGVRKCSSGAEVEELGLGLSVPMMGVLVTRGNWSFGHYNCGDCVVGDGGGSDRDGYRCPVWPYLLSILFFRKNYCIFIELLVLLCLSVFPNIPYLFGLNFFLLSSVFPNDLPMLWLVLFYIEGVRVDDGSDLLFVEGDYKGSVVACSRGS